MNLQAYILNSDGTIQRVDYTGAVLNPFQDGATNDGAIATSLVAGTSSSITSLSDGTDDYVFATSNDTANIYEVDGANGGSPFGAPWSLIGDGVTNIAGTFSSSVTTTAASSDETNLYASFRAFDVNLSSHNAIVTCSLYNSVPCMSSPEANASGSNFGNAGSLATISSVPALLFSDGSNVTGLYEENTASSFSFGTTFSPVATRVVTSPDGMWAGVLQASTFSFASTTTQTPVGSQAGSVATIWGFPFF
jgi:hypothetical protein